MLISIVTVNLNNLCGLIKTVSSVLSQTYDEKELIVIDGGSTDGSKGFIASHFTQFSYSVSETDHGVYDAMNKGILHVKGEYVLFMNSGDYFFNEFVLSEVFDKNKRSADIIYGYTLCSSGNGMAKLRAPHDLNVMSKYRISALCHQSSFIKSSLMKSQMYNTNYRILADYDFFYHCYLCNKTFEKVEKIISVYDTRGLSADNRNDKQIYMETCMIHHESANLIKYSIHCIIRFVKQSVKKMLPSTLNQLFQRLPDSSQLEFPLSSFKQL